VSVSNATGNAPGRDGGDRFDVIVVGGGNAGLCAAIAARERGARVLVLEKASFDERGGNSYFTGGGFRFAHGGLEDVLRDVLTDLSPAERDTIAVLPAYTAGQFYSDLMDVTDHQSDEVLARTLIDRSRETIVWMGRHRVRWLPMFNRQSYVVNGRHQFYGGLLIEASGSGAGLVTSLLAAAGKIGVEIRYDSAARRLLQDERGCVTGVEVRTPERIHTATAPSVVLACGGFEANPEWRTRYLGPDWELARVRGTRHNTGDGLRMALDLGAAACGHWSSCHAVAWDLSAPPFGDRTELDNFKKHSYTLGIVVNMLGQRFVDEGATYRNLTYAKYGREIMKQPRRMAVQIFDQKTVPLLRDEYRIRQVTKVQADTIEALATALEIDPAALARTVSEFNAACQPTPFRPAELDGKKAVGVTPPKSNWALPLDTPPYVGYVTTTGITFTFGGVRINADAEVQDTTGRSIPGLYAAGEMVGGLFYGNYPGGSGLTSGSVFGRIAGTSSAARALAAR
jgi:tricarballylate dehydrogenase